MTQSKILHSPDKSRVVGYLVNGQVVPLPPAPVGDMLDDLLFAATEMIENHPMRHGKLADALRPLTGQHSSMLTYGRLPFQMTDDGRPEPHLQSLYGGGVNAFIVEGSLRDVEQLRSALIEYVADQEEEYSRGRIGKDGHWEFTVNDLWNLGKKFGLAGPPTTEEREAASEANRKEWERRRRENDKDRMTMADFERASEITHRKKRLVAGIVQKFFTMDDLDVGGALPIRWYVVKVMRDEFRENYQTAIETLVDQGKSDDEILEEMIMQNAVTQGSYLSAVPDPLQEGEERHYANAKGVRDTLTEIDSTGKNLTHITSIMLCMDGRFCITLRPKTADDYAREAEIDAGRV